MAIPIHSVEFGFPFSWGLIPRQQQQQQHHMAARVVELATSASLLRGYRVQGSTGSLQIVQGLFSVVSKPIFATKYSL